MKLTKEALKQIIKEELSAVMNEAHGGIDEELSYADYDELRQMGDERLMAFGREQLEMKLAELREEYEDAMNDYRRAPDNAKADTYDFYVFPAEAAIGYIEEIISQLPEESESF